MKPDARDAAHLWSLVQPARYLVRAGATLTAEQLGKDQEKQYAVEKALERIGAAAGRLSPAFQAAHPHVPWGQIKGLEDMMAHGYRADWVRIQKTIVVEVPAFLAQIEPLLPELPPEEGGDAWSRPG